MLVTAAAPTVDPIGLRDELRAPSRGLGKALSFGAAGPFPPGRSRRQPAYGQRSMGPASSDVVLVRRRGIGTSRVVVGRRGVGTGQGVVVRSPVGTAIPHPVVLATLRLRGAGVV